MAPIQDSPSESLFHLEKFAQWVSLPPASLGAPLPALCASVFSPLLLTYYPPAGGIVLAWRDVQVSDAPPEPQPQPFSKHSSKSKSRSRKTQDEDSDESDADAETDTHTQPQTLLLKVIDEYSAPFLWATATLLVLRPRKNVYIDARITQQAATHLTLSYLNAFSVSVVRDNMPEDWVWCSAGGGGFSMTGGISAGSRNGGEGYWMDAEGRPIDGVVQVRITDWDARGEAKGGRGFLRIEGSLVGLERSASQGDKSRSKGKGKEKAKAKSALKARRPAEGESMEIE